MFESAKLKIDRAEHHINDLEGLIANFCEGNNDQVWAS
jgi:hypothetical protein